MESDLRQSSALRSAGTSDRPTAFRKITRPSLWNGHRSNGIDEALSDLLYRRIRAIEKRRLEKNSSGNCNFRSRAFLLLAPHARSFPLMVRIFKRKSQHPVKPH